MQDVIAHSFQNWDRWLLLSTKTPGHKTGFWREDSIVKTLDRHKTWQGVWSQSKGCWFSVCIWYWSNRGGMNVIRSCLELGRGAQNALFLKSAYSMLLTDGNNFTLPYQASGYNAKDYQLSWLPIMITPLRANYPNFKPFIFFECTKWFLPNSRSRGIPFVSYPRTMNSKISRIFVW